MISKKIEYLLWTLATDNTQLAAYAGCSESNFSRLKSGARQPSKDSLTVKKFVEALYSAAEDKHLMPSLLSLVDCNAGSDKEQVCEALVNWLFDDEGSSLPYSPWGIDARQFGEKLTLAMDHASLSNSRLSRLANIDPSYISRMKSGSRMPKNNPDLVGRLCSIIAGKAFESGSESELFELTGLPDGDAGDLSSAIFAWLYDKRSTEGALAVGRLIDRIAAMPQVVSPTTLRDVDIPESDLSTDVYIGNDGLRRAVTRFLKTASAGESRLLLYSDQPMDWMNGSFRKVWLSLMKACFECGVSIRIIHNIDRHPAEMIDAITSWLPLYMSGLIDPYYNIRRSGERFYSTVFLDEGRACIESHFIRGMESDARYRYITSQDELEYFSKSFSLLMQDCRSLIRITKGDEELSGNFSIYDTGGVSLCIGEGQVIVRKLTEPVLSFHFDHPLMIKAFKAFVQEDKKSKSL